MRIQHNKKDIVAQKTPTPLAKPTTKVAAKDKMRDFYFQNKDLDLISHELLCHHPCYKPFILGCSGSFRKTSPIINFEEALNHPISTVPLSLFSAGGLVRKTSQNKLVTFLIFTNA